MYMEVYDVSTKASWDKLVKNKLKQGYVWTGYPEIDKLTFSKVSKRMNGKPHLGIFFNPVSKRDEICCANKVAFLEKRKRGVEIKFKKGGLKNDKEGKKKA